MLRRAFRCLLPLIVNLTGIAPAQAILFQAPGADSEEFQKFALDKNQQTYTQWILRKNANASPEAHPQVIEFSQRALSEKSVGSLLPDWERLRTSIELNRSDREVLTLLAEKRGSSRELCRYVLLEPDLAELLENPQRIVACKDQATALPKNLVARLDRNDLLMIDGTAFTKAQLPERMIAGTYRWKIISDRFEDQSFTGTAEEFAKLNSLPPRSWVRGYCQDYQMQTQDFALLVQAQVYFNANCVNPGIPRERTFNDWASEHKALLWGVGLLAAAMAATQLRDKTLVITKP